MGSNPPTESEARAIAEELLEQIRGVEITDLEHTDHTEGHEHQFHFEIEHPQGVDTAPIYQKNAVQHPSFRWVKGITGINEAGPTSTEGVIRCYYGD